MSQFQWPMRSGPATFSQIPYWWHIFNVPYADAASPPTPMIQVWSLTISDIFKASAMTNATKTVSPLPVGLFAHDKWVKELNKRRDDDGLS